MSRLQRSLPRVVCLWGSHRPSPDLDASGTPSNADKGARELKSRGYEIRSISPWAAGKEANGAIRKVRYVARLTDLLMAATPSNSVVYTADIAWVRVLAALKRRGVLRRRVVVHWGGVDFDPESLSNREYLQRHARLFGALDAIWLASENERRIWSEALPKLSDRMAFHPMPVDLEYYAQIVPSALVHDVVAIGSDPRRDWEIPIGLASNGLRVAIVTEDHDVRRRVRALPFSVQSNITLAFRSGFQQTARIAASAKLLLVATTPNYCFTGSTTLAMAIALGRPLLIDEPFDLPAYGAHPGLNCETFVRGDLPSALSAARRLLAEPAHAKAMGSALAQQHGRVDIRGYVDRLEASFRPDWSPHHAALHAAPDRQDVNSMAAAWH